MGWNISAWIEDPLTFEERMPTLRPVDSSACEPLRLWTTVSRDGVGVVRRPSPWTEEQQTRSVRQRERILEISCPKQSELQTNYSDRSPAHPLRKPAFRSLPKVHRKPDSSSTAFSRSYQTQPEISRSFKLKQITSDGKEAPHTAILGFFGARNPKIFRTF